MNPRSTTQSFQWGSVERFTITECSEDLRGCKDSKTIQREPVNEMTPPLNTQLLHVYTESNVGETAVVLHKST